VPLSLALPTIDAPCDTRSPTAHRPLPCPRCARRRAALATQPARAPCSRAFRAKRWTSYSPSCAYKMEPHSLTCTHLATPLTLPTAARHCGLQGEPPLRGITAPPFFPRLYTTTQNPPVAPIELPLHRSSSRSGCNHRLPPPKLAEAPLSPSNYTNRSYVDPSPSPLLPWPPPAVGSPESGLLRRPLLPINTEGVVVKLQKFSGTFV
jgi:hypothetical protein